MDKYLNILTDSMVKKSSILDTISEICARLEECLTGENIDIDRYNTVMEEKGKLIDELNLLDDGFTALYERIAPALRSDPKSYADKLKRLKELITEVSDKTALIQAREMRLQSRIDRLVQMGQQHRGPRAGAAEAAMRYGRIMNKTSVPSSIFVDNKPRRDE